MVHSTRATSELLVDATPGEIVVIEVSTFDLSKGRVLERKQQNDNEQ
jgi:hypothetical protein